MNSLYRYRNEVEKSRAPPSARQSWGRTRAGRTGLVSSIAICTIGEPRMAKRRRRVLESDSEEEDRHDINMATQPAARDRLLHAEDKQRQPTKQYRTGGTDVVDVAAQLRQPAGAHSTAELLLLLRQLDTFPMTLGVLRESDVAKAVKPLRDHTDARVASTARELFAKWKREAKASSSRAPAAPAAEPSYTEEHAVCQPTATPAAVLRGLLSRRAGAASTREAAQRRVYTSMVAKFRGAANFTALTKTHISHAFALIDKELLDGQLAPLLKQERRRIRFRVAPRMTARAGQLMTEHAKPREHELAISSTLLLQTFQRGSREVVVNGCRCADRTEALLRVVEHEMIHLLFLCDGMPPHCRTQAHHGPAFCSAVKKLFGHKDYRHDLVTPREVAAAGGVAAGSTVRFTMAGETLTGKVNRVTKRATVLVKCTAGHCDARQFSDGEHYRKFFVPVEDCVVLQG